jgi:hypothetical protein
MPNDLESAFAALSDDAARARLAPAASLRRRSDRRVVTRSLAGVAAAAVLVAGVTVGARLVLADEALPPLPPAQSTAPTVAPSPAPSLSPSATPSSPPPSSPSSPPPSSPPETEEPSIPKSIPARAFLTRSDANVAQLYRSDSAHGSPDLCSAASYPSDSKDGVRGTSNIVYRNPGDGEDYTPVGQVADTVVVYRGDGAEEFMDELRAAVRNCPEGKRDNLTYKYRSLGSVGAGDESVLIQGSTPARGDNGELESDGSTYKIYFAAVRVGDSVALVENTGYESISAERPVAESFARKAAQRLENWRS